jgi:hypothetical protein
MRVELFCFTCPYFSWSWKIDPDEVRSALSRWLSRHGDVHIREIRHDTVASFWYPPQLLVTIYYDEAGEGAPAPRDAR